MNKFYAIVEDICRQDKRYKPDAYEFIMQGLNFTQKNLKKQGHLSGRELALGLRDFSISQYGPMAKTVLKHWGITKTRDFGNIVFNMIEKKLFSKTQEDSKSDFDKVYDFNSAFKNILRESIARDIK